MDWMRRHPLLFLFPIIGFACLFRLDQHRLYSWDEAVYAQVAREMLSLHDWVTTHWQYQKFFQPPLLFWATAGFGSWLGVGELSTRLFPALSGVALITFVFLIARRVFDPQTAFASTVILLMSGRFLWQVRFASMDAPLAAFLYAAIFVWVRWGAVSGAALVFICLALGVLTKGAAAFVVFSVLLLVVIWQCLRAGRIGALSLLLGVACFSLAVAPWHFFVISRFGFDFAGSDPAIEMFRRFGDALHFRDRPWYYYISVLWLYLQPFSGLLVLAAGMSHRLLRRSAPAIVLAATGFVIFAFSTATPARLPWSIFPAVPAAAIFIGAAIAQVFRSRNVPFVATAAVLVLAGHFLIGRPLMTFMMAATAVLIGMITAWPGLIRPLRAAFAVVVIVAAGWNVVQENTRREFDTVADLSLKAARQHGADLDPIVVFNQEWGPAAVFYSDRVWCYPSGSGSYPAPADMTSQNRNSFGPRSVIRCLEAFPAVHAVGLRTDLDRLGVFYRVEPIASIKADNQTVFQGAPGDYVYARISRIELPGKQKGLYQTPSRPSDTIGHDSPGTVRPLRSSPRQSRKPTKESDGHRRGPGRPVRRL